MVKGSHRLHYDRMTRREKRENSLEWIACVMRNFLCFVLFHFFSQFNIWHLRSRNYERHKCKVINYLSYLTTSKNYYWLSDSNAIQITFISVPFQFRSGYRSSLLFSVSVSNFRSMPFNRPEHILNVSNSQTLPFYRTCNARQFSNSN